MIQQAAKSARRTLNALGLSLKHVDLSVEFAVEHAASIAGEAPVKLVTLGGSVTASHSQTQSVKLTFERK